MKVYEIQLGGTIYWVAAVDRNEALNIMESLMQIREMSHKESFSVVWQDSQTEDPIETVSVKTLKANNQSGLAGSCRLY